MRVHVLLTNRYAQFLKPYPKALKDIFGYMSPSAYFSPLYHKRDSEGNRLWSGIISFLKYDKVPSGLFLTLKDKIEHEYEVEFKIKYARDKIKFRDYAESDRSYQNECIEAMRKNSKCGGIILSATGCVVGSTLIDTPRNLKKNMYGIPIKKLVGTKPWVYGWDAKEHKITLARASKVWKSGTKVKVYKVTFKVHGFDGPNGPRVYNPPSYIIGTAEHPVLLRKARNKEKRGSSGYNYKGDTWVNIIDLKPGDRVMPFMRRLGEDSSYSKINLNNGTKEIESRFILSKVRKAHTTYYHAHHKDENTWNNSIKNLQWKQKSKHFSQHATKRNLNKTFGWQAYGRHPRGQKGKTQTRYQKLCASLTAKRLKFLLHRAGYSVSEIAKKFGTTKWFVLRRAAYFNIDIENNHVVEKVEFYGYEDVYNITVPKTQNYIANGIVVHNSGKTFIAGRFFQSLVGTGVFIVDELGLLSQAQQELSNVLGEKVGYIGNMKFLPQRITVATAQTLHKHRNDPKFAKWQNNLDVAIIDELHEMLGKRSHTIISSIQPKASFGLTATLQYKKKKVMMLATALTGPIIYKFPLEKGVKKKYLVPGIAISVNVIRGGHKHLDYWESYDKIISKSKKFNIIVEKIIRAALKRDKYVMTLVHRPKHIRILSRHLNDIEHRVAYGEVKVRDRVHAKKLFQSKKVKLLIANQVFKKGTNIPRVDLMIDAANRPSHNDAQQKYGRGVRLCKNKEGLIYIDIGFKNPPEVEKEDYNFNRFQKGTTRRRKALAALGLPVYTFDWNGSGKEVIDFAIRKLRKVTDQS